MELIKDKYTQMQEILIESAKLYLQDLDDIIVDTAVVENDQQMFKHHMQVIYDRYHAEPCNILYCDLDMVIIKPWKIFGEWDKFTMLRTNCGVRYYPHGGMGDDVWQIQIDGMKDWPTADVFDFDIPANNPKYKWDREQDIYQLMSEYTDQYDKFDPYIWNSYNEHKGTEVICHCNGTGQQYSTIDLMSNLLSMSKRGEYDQIKTMLNGNPYRNWASSGTAIDWQGGWIDPGEGKR